jgi:hypothetical protein
MKESDHGYVAGNIEKQADILGIHPIAFTLRIVIFSTDRPARHDLRNAIQ